MPATSVSFVGNPGVTQSVGTNASYWTIWSATNVTSTTALTANTAKADILRTELGGSTQSPQTLIDATHGSIVFPRQAGSLLLVKFWGQGADNATATANVWIWHGVKRAGSADPTTAIPEQWHPTLLCSLALTVSGKVGVSGGLIGTSDRYVDTITISSDRGLSPNFSRVLTPSAADDGSVTLALDPLNAPLIEIEVRNGTTTAFNFATSWVTGV